MDTRKSEQQEQQTENVADSFDIAQETYRREGSFDGGGGEGE